MCGLIKIDFFRIIHTHGLIKHDNKTKNAHSWANSMEIY